MADKFAELTKTVTLFIQGSIKHQATTDANLNTLTVAVTENTKASREATLSNAEVKIDLSHAMDKIDQVAESHQLMDRRIHVLELVNAAADGKKDGLGLREKRLFKNWQKNVALLTLLVGVGTFIYTLLTAGK